MVTRSVHIQRLPICDKKRCHSSATIEPDGGSLYRLRIGLHGRANSSGRLHCLENVYATREGRLKKGGTTLEKYLLLWSLNKPLIPTDPKERASSWGMMLEMVKTDMNSGLAKDWGAFPGENRGYIIAEGTTLDIMKMTQQFAPYVSFEIHPVASINQIGELLLHMSG